MNKLLCLLLFLSMPLLGCAKVPSETTIIPQPVNTVKVEKSNIAEKIKYLSPTDFPKLPKDIAENLVSRGCKIPQADYWNKLPHNIINGEFRQKGQNDWAVLCSQNGISTILIFWNGATGNVAKIAEEPDTNYLQSVDGQGTIGFSRSIEPANKDYIKSHDESFAKTHSLTIHQGINDIYAEKASVVHYFSKNKWFELKGAD